MKARIVILLGSLFVLTLTGCEDLRYSKYDGQQKAWPTGSAFSEAVYDVPVYRGWPEKAYEVIGYIQFSQRELDWNHGDIDWNQGDMKLAARKAKKMGGEAMLMIPGGDVTSPTLATMRNNLGISNTITIALVLKWK